MTLFFYESVRHANSHVTTPLIPCGPPSGGEKNTQTTWHALHKGPMKNKTLISHFREYNTTSYRNYWSEVAVMVIVVD